LHKQAAKAIHKLNHRYKVSVANSCSFYYPGDDAWLSHISANIMQYKKEDYFIDKFTKNCDFLGVNYYFSNRVFGYRVHNPNEKVSDVQWDMQPADIQFVLERLHRRYKLPILITENGLADGEDKNRQWWITETIIGMQNAMKYGVKLIGYLHWSLMDNFEWAYGKWPRFGLVEINYSTGERKLRPSALWFGRVIKKIRSV
jgi:beta-glucosidase